jgi:hypothetical protein
MLDKLFHSTIHSFIYWVALCGVAVGLPSSIFLLSVSTLLLSVNYLLEGKFHAKWEAFRSNRLLLLIVAFFCFHLLAMCWSTNQAYGWHDIKVKLPLFSLPIVILSSKPLPNKIKQRILLLFLITTLLFSIINYGHYLFIGAPKNMDLRKLSLFISHIRFGLLVVVAITVCIHFSKVFRPFRWVFYTCALWLVFYTLISNVLSAYLSLLLVFAFLLLRKVYFRSKAYFWRISGLSMMCLIVAFFYFSHQNTNFSNVNLKNLPKYTPSGNLYTHDSNINFTENGHPVFLYLCYKELENEWAKASQIPYDSLDKQGCPIYATLVRYMTSKGLHKDSLGFSKLSQVDIHNIENGISSIRYLNSNLFLRLEKLHWEFQVGMNPNGHSLLQRFIYWKTACEIIRKNMFFGIGTGDVNDAFQAIYTQNHSALLPQYRLRAHQQILTVFLSFGLLGLLIFVWIHLHFLKISIFNKDFLSLCFLIVLLTSYLSEDTLETQTGITFFAFFIAFFGQKTSASKGSRLQENIM